MNNSLFFSLLCVYTRTRALARREDGAIALATFAFMLVTGLIAIITLWSIGYATGAYNQLYVATQASAYAAAGKTQSDIPGYDQLIYDCNSTYVTQNGLCTDGPTADTAASALDAALPDPTGSTTGFGVTFQRGNRASSVRMIGTGASEAAPGSAMLHAFSIPYTPAAAKDAASGRQCPAFETLPDGGSARLCWTVREVDPVTAIGNEVHYESGVVVRTKNRVSVPGCGACPEFPLEITAAATNSQSEVPIGY